MITTSNPQFQSFGAFVGEWTIEVAHRLLPGVLVRGSTVFEWLEGEQFLIQRARMEHPDFPDAIAIIGVLGDGLAMHSYDSRGLYPGLGDQLRRRRLAALARRTRVLIAIRGHLRRRRRR